jgi:hypothetical protein
LLDKQDHDLKIAHADRYDQRRRAVRRALIGLSVAEEGSPNPFGRVGLDPVDQRTFAEQIAEAGRFGWQCRKTGHKEGEADGEANGAGHVGLCLQIWIEAEMLTGWPPGLNGRKAGINGSESRTPNGGSGLEHKPWPRVVRESGKSRRLLPVALAESARQRVEASPIGAGASCITRR